MKVNELRIGNFISDVNASDSFFAQVKKLDYSRCYYGQFHSAYSDLKPIPLTEDWLLKFGFELKGFYRLKVTSFLELCWKPHDNTLNLQTEKNGFTENSKCKYVHQLQNLYFALTGEELSIKYL